MQSKKKARIFFCRFVFAGCEIISDIANFFKMRNDIQQGMNIKIPL